MEFVNFQMINVHYSLVVKVYPIFHMDVLLLHHIVIQTAKLCYVNHRLVVKMLHVTDVSLLQMELIVMITIYVKKRKMTHVKISIFQFKLLIVVLNNHKAIIIGQDQLVSLVEMINLVQILMSIFNNFYIYWE